MCVCVCVYGCPLEAASPSSSLTSPPPTPSSPKPQELGSGRPGVKPRGHLGEVCPWLSALSLWLSFTCCPAQTSLPRRLGRGQAWLCWDPETRAGPAVSALERLEDEEWRRREGMAILGTWGCEEPGCRVPWLLPLAHLGHVPEGASWGCLAKGGKRWVGWKVVMTRILEHCDDRNHGAL